MTTYGVTPQGFARKPLDVILSEIEEAARSIFGAGVIQTAASPLGQLNGLMASIVATAWEIAESTYQSYDPDQAEGVRLEMLARIRLLERMSGEADPAFRAAITNADRARIDLADIDRAVRNIDGVTWVHVWENPGSTIDAAGLDPHPLAVAALGGDDVAVATAVRAYVVPGIDAFGNVPVSTTIEGYCRTIAVTRPVEVRVGLRLTVTKMTDRTGCPAPTDTAIAAAVAAAWAGDDRPPNGADVTLHQIRTALAAFPAVEVTAATATLPDVGPTVLSLPLPIGFFEIASVAIADVTVV